MKMAVENYILKDQRFPSKTKFLNIKLNFCTKDFLPGLCMFSVNDHIEENKKEKSAQKGKL